MTRSIAWNRPARSLRESVCRVPNGGGICRGSIFPNRTGTSLRSSNARFASASTHTERIDAAKASRKDVELYFAVTKTGRRASHYTGELPHPVTDEVAARFNAIFGRADKGERNE